MFPIILITVFAVLLVACITGFVIALRGGRNNDALGFPSVLGGVIVLCLLIAVVVIWPSTYFSSVGTIARMEAFYHDTLDAYEYTVTATGNIEITNAEVGLIDIAYQEQGLATSERLRELRDRVEWFNASLRRYERFNSTFIAGAFLANVPDDLAPIRITINEEES